MSKGAESTLAAARTEKSSAAHAPGSLPRIRAIRASWSRAPLEPTSTKSGPFRSSSQTPFMPAERDAGLPQRLVSGGREGDGGQLALDDVA